MKNLKPEVKVYLNDENASIESTESRFLQSKLEEYLNSNSKCRNTRDYSELNYFTSLDGLLTEYVVRNFTLEEAYTIFCVNTLSYMLDRDHIRCSKQLAIDAINDNPDYSEQEKKRLRKKVWDMPKVLFGLVHEFIHLSELFYDEDEMCNVFPDLS